MQRFSLEGKVALVTGGGRGLGKGMAKALAEARADLVIVSRSLKELEETAREIEVFGRKVVPVAADVTKSEEIFKIINTVLEKFGHLEILVNAAGVNKRMASLEVTPELWDMIMDVNLKAVFFVSQAVAKIMIKQGGGSIINIASLLSAVGIPTLAPYAASKSGVVGLTRVLAAEWGPYGIRVNCIAPGYFPTKMTETLFSNSEWVSRLIKQVPLGRSGTPEDLAGAVVFLASDASCYITGQVLYVDGGYLIAREA